MNTIRQGAGVRFLLAGALLAGFVALQATAAPSAGKGKPAPDNTNAPRAAKADVHHPAVKVQFDHKAVAVHKKAAISHKPIRAIHPKTKKPIPDHHELTLPNGRKVKVGPYMAELNKYERKLNELGHSLHHEGKTTLARARVGTAKMDQKASAVAAHHRAFDPKTMKRHVKRDKLQAGFLAGDGKDKARVERLKKALGNANAAARGSAPAAGTTKNWHWELGRRNVVAAYL